MTELERISAAWSKATRHAEEGVLATVVRVAGSTYRRPGARLLLSTGGQRIGSVSGGCLEADLSKKAWWLTRNGECVIREYDTSGETGVAQEFGLGCNGVIHVLLERPGQSSLLWNAVEFVRKERRPVLVATVVAVRPGVSLSVGERWVQYPDGTVKTSIGDAGLLALLPDAILRSRAASNGQQANWELPLAGADFFVESIQPGLRLLVFGAGDDAMPMVQLARFMGYETVVLDGRSHLARADRFPMADHVEVVTLDGVLGSIRVDDWTAAVLMSHSYVQDLQALRALAACSLPYLGLLGPRKRTERMLAEAGIRQPVLEDSMHSPMGLDIGADGAEQIALATIAEIQSVLNRRAGGQLRVKAGPLHIQPVGDSRWVESEPMPLSCSLDY
jgi:xanthine dehydrogenase accessory factor